jgi:hypothetical protein
VIKRPTLSLGEPRIRWRVGERIRRRFNSSKTGWNRKVDSLRIGCSLAGGLARVDGTAHERRRTERGQGGQEFTPARALNTFF